MTNEEAKAQWVEMLASTMSKEDLVDMLWDAMGEKARQTQLDEVKEMLADCDQ